MNPLSLKLPQDADIVAIANKVGEKRSILQEKYKTKQLVWIKETLLRHTSLQCTIFTAAYYSFEHDAETFVFQMDLSQRK
uniref:Dynein light chain n=1 Tax=Ditylenchus dipsaci TaxID=166011 RepID=A0A915CP61_9BILA